jgi:hypothetical protein
VKFVEIRGIRGQIIVFYGIFGLTISFLGGLKPSV